MAAAQGSTARARILVALDPPPDGDVVSSRSTPPEAPGS